MFCAACRHAFVGQGKAKPTLRADSIVRQTIDSKQWRKVKAQVIARDGPICQNHYRHGISRAFSGQQLQLDHICPQEARPDRIWDLENLENLCAACHARKTTEESGLGASTRRNGAKPLRITWDFRPTVWVASGYNDNPRQIEAFQTATHVEHIWFLHEDLQQLARFIHQYVNPPQDMPVPESPNGRTELPDATLIICPRQMQYDIGFALKARFFQFLPGLNT